MHKERVYLYVYMCDEKCLVASHLDFASWALPGFFGVLSTFPVVLWADAVTTTTGVWRMSVLLFVHLQYPRPDEGQSLICQVRLGSSFLNASLLQCVLQYSCFSLHAWALNISKNEIKLKCIKKYSARIQGNTDEYCSFCGWTIFLSPC